MQPVLMSLCGMCCKLNVIIKMHSLYFSHVDGFAPLVNCIKHVSSPLLGLSGPLLNCHVIISEGKERPACLLHWLMQSV